MSKIIHYLRFSFKLCFAGSGGKPQESPTLLARWCASRWTQSLASLKIWGVFFLCRKYFFHVGNIFWAFFFQCGKYLYSLCWCSPMGCGSGGSEWFVRLSHTSLTPAPNITCSPFFETKMESVMLNCWWLNPQWPLQDYDAYTELEIHAELVYAECLLLKVV